MCNFDFVELTFRSEMKEKYLFFFFHFSHLFRNFATDIITIITMSEKNYKTPVVAWLKVTDYMHGWLQRELGGGARIGGKRVVSLGHLDGARDALRMETANDVTGDDPERLEQGPVSRDGTMSATRWSCIDAGLTLDARTVERLYGISREELALYLPIECPRVCLTPLGVLRPWTTDTCFGRQQTTALQRLLREAFWQGVAEYNHEYARRQEGRKYAAVDMIEAFCRDMETSDLYVDALRREWQRRCKRADG
jgi:hypothetical protein